MLTFDTLRNANVLRLGDATLSKWNRVSERVGVPTRIKTDGAVTWVDSGAESV